MCVPVIRNDHQPEPSISNNLYYHNLDKPESRQAELMTLTRITADDIYIRKIAIRYHPIDPEQCQVTRFILPILGECCSLAALGVVHVQGLLREKR